jgi:hypothetical protein
MNDFSELETELKKLRPAPASPELAIRIERALTEAPSTTRTAGVLPQRRRGFRLNWLALGLGLAAAATFLLLARVNVDRTPAKNQSVALASPNASTSPPMANDNFVPAGMTQVVYNTRDEGLLFAHGADQPVRRLRSRKRETLRWQNPGTGASLQVSYPSEEVTLIPVPGQ